MGREGTGGDGRGREGTDRSRYRSPSAGTSDLKSQISALFLTQRPPDEWPDALDHLAIGFIASKCTKHAKISEILSLSLGLSYMKIPGCSSLFSIFFQKKLLVPWYPRLRQSCPNNSFFYAVSSSY